MCVLRREKKKDMDIKLESVGWWVGRVESKVWLFLF